MYNAITDEGFVRVAQKTEYVKNETLTEMSNGLLNWVYTNAFATN